MKTIWTLFLGLYLTANFATAQDTLYVYKAGVIAYKSAVSTIDSVTFYKQNTVTDIDGNVYKTVTIGTQTWMAENLKVTHYRDGSAISNVTNNSTWCALSTGAYCYYNNLESNGTTYGCIYNWYAVADVHNIAPLGWHVPTEAEWTILENYASVHFGSSISQAKALATTTVWTSCSTTGTIGSNALINNSTGFSAIPSGSRSVTLGGTFFNAGNDCYWWTVDELNTSNAWQRCMNYSYSYVLRGNQTKSHGFYVRCIRDY